MTWAPPDCQGERMIRDRSSQHLRLRPHLQSPVFGKRDLATIRHHGPDTAFSWVGAEPAVEDVQWTRSHFAFFWLHFYGSGVIQPSG
jgi:hypothetical protein